MPAPRSDANLIIFGLRKPEPQNIMQNPLNFWVCSGVITLYQIDLYDAQNKLPDRAGFGDTAVAGVLAK